MNSVGIIVIITALVALSSGAEIGRIVGGDIVSTKKYPYVVSLQDDMGKHFCGGTIIDKRWILTAANCFTGMVNCEKVKIRVGSDYTDSQGELVDADKCKSHAQYNASNNWNDIALVHVTKDIVFTELIKPVKLPMESTKEKSLLLKIKILKKFFSKNTDTATFLGWGSDKFSRIFKRQATKLVNKLRVLKADVLSTYQCKKGVKGFVPKDQICTSAEKGKGLSTGDSGGPLISTNGEQMGIASNIPAGAGGESPQVYTKVSSYKGWIDSTMKTISA